MQNRSEESISKNPVAKLSLTVSYYRNGNILVDRGFDINKQVLEWAKRIRGVHMPSSVTTKKNGDLGVIILVSKPSNNSELRKSRS